MQPLEWVEKAEQKIKENKEQIIELDKISSCDYRAYQHAKADIYQMRNENTFLLEGCKIIRSLQNGTN